jgi:putative DNA-invertase from lambdoid prophage Rac
MVEKGRTMATLVYTRVSTDEQSTRRQTHVLTEAGLTEDSEGGVRFFSDPAISSKIPSLRRDGFQKLAAYARPGDTLTVSELYRLCRDLADILAVRTWCQDHDVKLRVLCGALSGITDLAATDATTTMLVNVLVSVGQFQRDLQNELTRDGLAAAWALGAKSGRQPQVAKLGVTDEVRQAFCTGSSIAALARKHHVSRGAIRTAVADLLPNQPATTSVTEPEVVRVEMPGKIARHLQNHDSLGEKEQHALRQGRTIRRGQGYSLHVTAAPQVHQTLLAAAVTLNAQGAPSADRKAYRIYWERLNSKISSHRDLEALQPSISRSAKAK